MKELVVETKGLKKYYKRGEEIVHALDGVNLEVRKGELISIVGPSGSGKTTLMNLLGLLDTPTDGILKIDGVAAHELSEGELVKVRRDKLGFIFQKFYLIPTLSVKENILLPLFFSRERVDEARFEDIIKKVGLEGKENVLPQMLSGGDKQKVSIARALIKNIRLLLADEPTGRLDTRMRDEILEIFKRLMYLDIAIIIVTHDLSLARKTQRIIHLQDGKIIPEQASMLYR